MFSYQSQQKFQLEEKGFVVKFLGFYFQLINCFRNCWLPQSSYYYLCVVIKLHYLYPSFNCTGFASQQWKSSQVEVLGVQTIDCNNPKRRTNIWQHFKKFGSPDSEYAECVICKRVLKRAKNSSSSNLWKHLRKHSIFP